MPSPSDHELARLLSGRNEPSVLEKEQEFEAIWSRVEAPRRRRRVLAWASGTALAAAAAMALLPGSQRQDRDAFTARGATPVAEFGVTCVNAALAPAPCQAGARLLLQLTPPAARPYFALFLRRPDGAVVWYFPAANGVMPDASKAAGAGPWGETPLLPTDAKAGRHTLFAVFAASALDRAQLKRSLGDQLKGDASVQVVSRTLELEARP